MITNLLTPAGLDRANRSSRSYRRAKRASKPSEKGTRY